jgi:hypothetical protein
MNSVTNYPDYISAKPTPISQKIIMAFIICMLVVIAGLLADTVATGIKAHNKFETDCYQLSGHPIYLKTEKLCISNAIILKVPDND